MKSVTVLSDKLDFHITQAPLPVPGKGELLVKLSSAVIQPSDKLAAVGVFGPVSYPHALGLEGFGEVIVHNRETDDSSSNYGEYSDLTGKQVAFWSLKASSFSEYSIVPVKDAIITPKYDLTDKAVVAKASNFFLNPVTALGLLDLVKKAKSTAIAFNTGYSQVNQYLTKLCKKEGIKTVVIVRKEEQVKLCSELGATAVLNQTASSFTTDFQAKVKELGVTYFIDSIQGEEGARVIALLNNDSRVTTYGALSGVELSAEFKQEQLKRGISIEFFFFAVYYYGLSGDQRKEVGELIAKEIDGIFKTHVYKTVKQDDLPYAFKEYNNDMGKGKYVVEY